MGGSPSQNCEEIIAGALSSMAWKRQRNGFIAIFKNERPLIKYTSPPRARIALATLAAKVTYSIGTCKSNYHTIAATISVRILWK